MEFCVTDEFAPLFIGLNPTVFDFEKQCSFIF